MRWLDPPAALRMRELLRIFSYLSWVSAMLLGSVDSVLLNARTRSAMGSSNPYRVKAARRLAFSWMSTGIMRSLRVWYWVVPGGAARVSSIIQVAPKYSE